MSTDFLKSIFREIKKGNLPVIYVFFLTGYLFWFSAFANAMDEDYACEETSGTRIWISPLNPEPDEKIRIMAVSTDDPVEKLALIGGGEHLVILQTRQRGGPPWSLTAELEGLTEGRYRIAAGRNEEMIACRFLVISESATPQERQQHWNLAIEAFYSAWIEKLFGVPHNDKLNFSSMEPIFSDPERNFLYNYLRQNEDQRLILTPDCADLPYVLRAYFAWKVGLPVAYRACGRGTASAPPHCGAPVIMTEFTRRITSQAEFSRFNRLLANTVHSGAIRTGLADESTDLYPVPLTRDALWPGTVFADPYGHILVLAEWVQQTDDQPGMLLAVDAQPDNTVARKRVWEGTLLFANIRNAGAGFKAFRPVIQTAQNTWRVLSNAELHDHADFVSYSLEQDQLSTDDFYAKLGNLINPQGQGALQVYDALLAGLIEQLETRVISVNNVETYFLQNPHRVIPMPSGASIFQTAGPWEDYATPSRDMRLIIAFNVLLDLPDKITRHPELFILHGKKPEEIKAEIERYHEKQIQEYSLHYIRSDGSPWKLSIAEILARQPAFEMAYNPNDCAEKRWGAQPGTAEYQTCLRQAPETQQSKMVQYRPWFREMRRPMQ